MPQLYNFRPPARMETSGIGFLTREWGNLRSVDLYYPQVFDIAFGYHAGCSTPGDLVVCPADNLDIVRSSGGFGPTYVLDLVYYPGGSGDLRNVKRNDIFFIANKENSGDPKPRDPRRLLCAGRAVTTDGTANERTGEKRQRSISCHF